MLNRYTGDVNKRIRVEQLQAQKIVAGNLEVAQKLESMGEIELVEANKTLIEEGGVDNEVYFILAGKMNVFVKGNFVAERVSGDHVGEMVALNPDSRRTATIRAIEDSIVLKISEADFTNLLDQHPIMYKSIAKTLAKRLDDRKCLLKPVPIIE
jgi:CRP-like cAMP-binding protein